MFTWARLQRILQFSHGSRTWISEPLLWNPEQTHKVAIAITLREPYQKRDFNVKFLEVKIPNLVSTSRPPTDTCRIAERTLINDDHWHQFQREIALEIEPFIWQFLISRELIVRRRKKSRKRAQREANEENWKSGWKCLWQILSSVNTKWMWISWSIRSSGKGKVLCAMQGREPIEVCAKSGGKINKATRNMKWSCRNWILKRKTTANVTNVLVTKWLNDDPATEALLRISWSYHWALHWNVSEELQHDGSAQSLWYNFTAEHPNEM